MRLIVQSCHYMLCKPGFRVILFNGGPLSRSYKLSHNLLFNTKVQPWLPKGKGKTLHEWTHQRKDHSTYRINPNHCRTSAAAAIPASGKHWLETIGTVPDIFPTKQIAIVLLVPLTSGFRENSSGPRPKPGNVGFCTSKEGLETSYLWHVPEQPGLWALIFKFGWNKYKKNSL